MEVTRSASPLQLEFDQYHRYAALALLLKPLLAAHERPARLLEIHGTALNLLAEFFAPLTLEVTQAELQPSRGNRAAVLLPRDARVPLPDQSVDYTLALEALEQVPAEDRTYCVSEWLRVAREGIVISCPITRGARQPQPAPRRKNGRPFRPTSSSEEETRPPTTAEVRGLLDKLGLTYVTLAPVSPAEWLPLLVLLEENHPLGSAKLVGVLQQLLKMRLFRAFTHQRPYRRLFLAWKTAAQARAAQERWFPQQLPSTTPLLRRGESTEGALLHPVMTLASRLSASFATPHAAETVVPRPTEVAPTSPSVERLTRQTREQQAALERQQREHAWREWQLVEELIGFPPEVNQAPAPGMSGAEAEGLSPVPPDTHTWEAMSPEAHFRWPVEFPAGWVRLRLTGRGPKGEAVRVQLRGEGRETSILLGRWQQAETLARYVFCDHPVTELRLQPRATPGPVRLDAWEAQASGKGRACMAGVGRLLADAWTVAGCWQTLRSLTRAWWQGGIRGVGRHCLSRALHPLRLADLASEPLSYADWIQHEERIDAARDQALARLCRRKELPALAVLLPVPAAFDREAVRRTLGSLAEQGYPRVEVLLAVTRQDVAALRTLLEEYPALRVITRLILPAASVHHGPIVLNELLSHVRGEYAVPVRAGDLLGREALLLMADALCAQPGADFLYTDEDRWSVAQGRHAPVFKPAWSPDRFITDPYTGHLAAFRTAACRRLGGFTEALADGFVTDLVCRLAQADGRNVVHVPRVLYHVQVPDGAESRTRADRAVLAQHLRKGLWGLHTESSADGIRLACVGTPRVSIIIPSAGKEVTLQGRRTTHLSHCLETLRARTTYANYEIIVVTNGSLGAAEAAAQGPAVKRVEVPPPFHFSASINAGVQAARGEYLLLLNDDTEVITPDWLETLLSHAAQPGVGAVGARLLFPDGRLQHAGVTLFARGPGHPYYGQEATPEEAARNCLAVTGACLLTPRAIFAEVGGFGMEFPLHYNDVDYCLKVHQSGRRIVYVPRVELYHFERQRRDGHAALQPDELQRFQQKWAAAYPRDPFWNANLCSWSGDSRLGRHQPRS